MRLLKKAIHEDYDPSKNPVLYNRIAARGIIMNGDDILLIYTKRYNDYSFPGGGVDKNEDIIDGLKENFLKKQVHKISKLLRILVVTTKFAPLIMKAMTSWI